MPSTSQVLVALTTSLALAAGAGCGAGSERAAHPTSATSRASTSAPSTRPAATSSMTAETATPTGATSRTAPAAAAPGPDAAQRALARMGLAQRVGQLFMVGSPATSASPTTLAAISRYHVGNVMLTGRSRGGTGPPARTAAALRARATTAATAGVPLFVATDQEGGLVQVLGGPGIATMPSGLSQGQLAPARLRLLAITWARQLRASGVNLDLAPVLDTVPAGTDRTNPPIGGFAREYGHTPATVTSHGLAFAGGLAAAGVAATAKHFPGLGRVTRNTDTGAGVTDRVTTRRDACLAPFAAAVSARVPFMMTSTATYTRIDPAHPASFSPTVIGGMLRHDLGFTGVVISDDLANARQVARWSPGSRAVQFLAAGGDMVLVVDAAPLPAMQRAVVAKALGDKAFRARVDASALRVLRAKAALHLLR